MAGKSDGEKPGRDDVLQALDKLRHSLDQNTEALDFLRADIGRMHVATTKLAAVIALALQKAQSLPGDLLGSLFGALRRR